MLIGNMFHAFTSKYKWLSVYINIISRRLGFTRMTKNITIPLICAHHSILTHRFDIRTVAESSYSLYMSTRTFSWTPPLQMKMKSINIFPYIKSWLDVLLLLSRFLHTFVKVYKFIIKPEEGPHVWFIEAECISSVVVRPARPPAVWIKLAILQTIKLDIIISVVGSTRGNCGDFKFFRVLYVDWRFSYTTQL